MIQRQWLELVAHELRSPVAALAALAEGYSSAPPETRRRLVELAIDAGRDIARILGDADLFSLRPELVDVGELASSYASDAVRVVVDGRATTCADPTRLRQALGNLVANGLRHGSRVTIGVEEASGTVVVDVTDDGPGVDPVIDPFARGASTTGSSGLGLWLARAVAQAHGGTLELVPSGPGARFRLVLPSASGAH